MTYPLKPETLEYLRNRAHVVALRRQVIRQRPSDDVLSVPLWVYYAKPQYSRRTDKWKTYGGNWGTEDKTVWLAPDWPAWRDLGDACDNVGEPFRHRHSGWYADHYGEEVIRGRVLQLPSRNGKPCYVPGTYCTGWEGVTVHPLDQYDTAEGAARVADSYAENQAEQSREWYAKDLAENEIESCHELAQAAIKGRLFYCSMGEGDNIVGKKQ